MTGQLSWLCPTGLRRCERERRRGEGEKIYLKHIFDYFNYITMYITVMYYLHFFKLNVNQNTVQPENLNFVRHCQCSSVRWPIGAPNNSLKSKTINDVSIFISTQFPIAYTIAMTSVYFYGNGSGRMFIFSSVCIYLQPLQRFYKK